MRRRSPAISSAVLAVALTCAASSSAAPALVIAATADDDPLRAAMAEAGIEALSKDETQAALKAAAGSGVVCAEVDVSCWQAVATLSGRDDVVIATPAEVITSNRVGVRRSPRLVMGASGLRGALLRLTGRTGAVVVTITPPSAVLTVKGAPVAGGIADGLAPGPVTVQASAEGFGTRTEDVVVVAGSVTTVGWELQPASAVADSGMSTTLRYGGLATIGVGAVAGVAIAAINFSANCRFEGSSMVCNPDEVGGEDHLRTKLVDVAAIAIGGGLAVVGSGATVASFLVE